MGPALKFHIRERLCYRTFYKPIWLKGAYRGAREEKSPNHFLTAAPKAAA